ncbi:hypothetical protein LZ30DRAFT_15547 [Colletotrichum cereale]|nr:hypothetical protein LZ30DRAFT_15547 [Colletotrichum cereale]
MRRSPEALGGSFVIIPQLLCSYHRSNTARATNPYVLGFGVVLPLGREATTAAWHVTATAASLAHSVYGPQGSRCRLELYALAEETSMMGYLIALLPTWGPLRFLCYQNARTDSAGGAVLQIGCCAMRNLAYDVDSVNVWWTESCCCTVCCRHQMHETRCARHVS